MYYKKAVTKGPSSGIKISKFRGPHVKWFHNDSCDEMRFRDEIYFPNDEINPNPDNAQPYPNQPSWRLTGYHALLDPKWKKCPRSNWNIQKLDQQPAC